MVVSKPLAGSALRAGFFFLWAAYMVWMAADSSRWYIRWPMAALGVVALGLAIHFVRLAGRKHEK